MALIKPEILTEVKNELRATDETVWSDAKLNRFIAQVVRQISAKEPLRARIALPIIQYSKDVDISSLTEISNVTVCACDAAWDNKANVTCDTDTVTKRGGTASAKQVIADGFTTGLIATEAVTSINLALYKSVRFWIRSNAAVAAGVLQFVLDNTALCASPLETFDIPALAADTWRLVEFDFVDPSSLTAVIAVGLNATSDPGEINVWIDKIEACGWQQAELLKIFGAEYKIGGYPSNFRNWDRRGDFLTLRISSIPTITSGTLTGTLTFTKDSNAVSGSGTLFTTELTENYCIRASAGTHWYRVIKVVSTTSLIIDEQFTEATVADDSDKTLYRDSASCMYLHYGRGYTVSTTTDMPTKMDDIAILGVVSYAANEWSSYSIQARVIAGIAKIANAVTEVGSVGARITQAVDDLALGKVYLETNLVSLTTDLTSMTARVEAAVEYLATGDDLINTANLGGTQAAQTYAQYAGVELDNATEYLERAKGYIASSTSSKDYVDYATGELNAANAYLSKATNYLNMIEQEVNISKVAESYGVWATRKMSEYHRALGRLGRVEDSVYGSYSGS